LVGSRRAPATQPVCTLVKWCQDCSDAVDGGDNHQRYSGSKVLYSMAVALTHLSERRNKTTHGASPEGLLRRRDCAYAAFAGRKLIQYN